ncbi:restriction endonuclease subunit S [Methylovorus menthalis]|uniref:restriction endonuclease subunit S n=1 Tax=Methylovorus menthalis TaxID=1002227 RepID=UPI00228758D0|nr:restriction endonuclease subunit S [Methylovorus menthalis]MCB4810974.1 restriction endonuclease subunit S [Methylovorus menthalis]
MCCLRQGLVSKAPHFPPYAVNQGVTVFKVDEENVERSYLAYWCEGPMFRGYIKGHFAGATQIHIRHADLMAAPLWLPTISIQRRIASILSAYDDLIENNMRRIAIFEEMARRIYEEWFVRFRFPGHELVKMVKSELGLIPEGWTTAPLSGLVTTQYGYTESTQDTPIGPKFLRGMDINKQTYIDWSAVPYCPISDANLPKFRLSKGDVLVIRMADPGKVGIVEKDVSAVFASYLVRLRIIDQRLAPYFLFYFLRSDRYQGYITGASTGTTRKSASAPVITGIDVILPPPEIMERFVEQVFLIRSLLNKLLEKNANLRATRDLLLPKLISGELDVSTLPESEEAIAE